VVRHLDTGLQKVSDGATPHDLATALLGSGSTDFDIVGAAYTGSNDASGIITAFPAQHYLQGYFASGAVVLTSGGASLALVVDNNSGASTSNNGGAGDAQLSANGHDASVLTLQLKAKKAGTLQFKYTFASEEYNGELCRWRYHNRRNLSSLIADTYDSY
jgi:hypothetical protein